MRKYFFVLVALLFAGQITKAAPGDTTWVQANINQLSWYGNYDSTVNFPAPGKTYRSIYMVFTLGKYMCGGSGYCGDWDYTVQNYLITPGGQTFELGRFITPYANANAPRTPWTWNQHYVFDVTDYAMLLHDSGKVRISYSGYSGGFTANIRFMFIEGTPDRDVLAIHRAWHGSFGYGDTSHHGANDINVHFPDLTETAPQFTKSAELKFTVTGHGSDANYCSEFCSSNYNVYLNGGLIDTYKIWRSDCGRNELYPQSGTWIYERANWCPGALVYSGHHKLPGFTGGETSTVGLRFDPYISSGGASYTTEGTLFYYGAMKKVLDASIEQIVAPTNNENHFRENPICGTPVVHVKNRGVATIDSIMFEYGVAGDQMQTSVWKGHLPTFDETDITLPVLPKLNLVAGDTAKYKFTVRILNVNGARDADSSNNIMASQFKPAPLWPSSFKIVFKPNSEPIATGSNISETSWAIYDMAGNLIQKRNNAVITTTYNDTVSLPTGCYKFVIYDSSCDGLQWWANPSAGAGFINVRKLTNINIPMNGYYYGGTYNNDFGCGFTQYFYINTPTAVTDISETGLALEAYPNPAQNTVNIELTGMQQVKGELHIIDALGRSVIATTCRVNHTQLNVSSLANGVYTVLFIDQASGNKLTARLLIAK